MFRCHVIELMEDQRKDLELHSLVEKQNRLGMLLKGPVDVIETKVWASGSRCRRMMLVWRKEWDSCENLRSRNDADLGYANFVVRSVCE
jgi:hypothetical protein